MSSGYHGAANAVKCPEAASPGRETGASPAHGADRAGDAAHATAARRSFKKFDPAVPTPLALVRYGVGYYEVSPLLGGCLDPSAGRRPGGTGIFQYFNAVIYLNTSLTTPEGIEENMA